MVRHNKCCVPNCNSESKVRHNFPNPEKDMDRFKIWINNISDIELMEMDPMKVYKIKRVCHDHFQEVFISKWSHKLFPNAVPTLNISGTSQSISQSIWETQTASRSTKSVVEGPSASGAEMTDLNEENTSNTEGIVDTLQSSSVDLLETAKSSRSPQLIKSCGETPSGSDATVIDLDDTNTSTAGNKEPLTPYRLLKQSGISRRTFTPREKKMYQAMKLLHKKFALQKNRKKSFRQRLADAETFRMNHFEHESSKLNHLTNMFIQCQLRECEKSKNMRRFTLNEKLLALILYKQSAKSYSLLSKMFILPSKSTLTRLLSEIVGGPGLYDAVFDSLQSKTAEMDSLEKYVAVLFDEMSIMPSLHFNEHLGLIEGFEDMGGNARKSSLADHVLVFMVRGIGKQWKSLISCHFSSGGGATSLQIKQLTEKILKKLLDIGLKPITVICDQYNASSINKLIHETREKHLRSENISQYRDGSFEVGDFSIFPLFDPPHLLKGVRNNFIKKNIIYVKDNISKIAKWSHIEIVYRNDSSAQDALKALPHLSDEHIYEKKMKKMKVKHAAQIFSQRLASTMRLVAQFGNEDDGNLEDTAQLLSLFDRLFDSVNGSNKMPDRGKSLRAGLNDESPHIDFWNMEALPILENMEFEKRSFKDQARPPSLKNWSFTIRNIKSIWEVLKKAGFKYLLPRRLNQDPLENAFGQLRSFGGQNNNPSCHQFIGTFKMLMFNFAVSIYKSSFNCEDDSCDNLFLTISKLLVGQNNANSDNFVIDKEYVKSPKITHEKLSELATTYVAGYILKKIKKKATCPNCRKCLFSDDYTSEQNLLIAAREYGGSFARRLCYPTLNFVEAFFEIFEIINFYLNIQASSKNLVDIIKFTIDKNVDFNFFSCEKEDHKNQIMDMVIKFSIRTLIHHWCNEVNNIIRGKKGPYTGENPTKQQANRIHSARMKRKNQKQPEPGQNI